MIAKLLQTTRLTNVYIVCEHVTSLPLVILHQTWDEIKPPFLGGKIVEPRRIPAEDVMDKR